MTPSIITAEHVREERFWYLFAAATRQRQSFLSAGTAIHQRLEQRKVVLQIFENALEVPLEPLDARPRFGTGRIPPRGELLRHGLRPGRVCPELLRPHGVCPGLRAELLRPERVLRHGLRPVARLP